MIELEHNASWSLLIWHTIDLKSFLFGTAHSYCTRLPQRASYLALHSYLFGLDGAINYDYIITNSINCLLIGSRCIPNGAHTNHCWTNLAQASKHIKNYDLDITLTIPIHILYKFYTIPYYTKVCSHSQCPQN